MICIIFHLLSLQFWAPYTRYGLLWVSREKTTTIVAMLFTSWNSIAPRYTESAYSCYGFLLMQRRLIIISMCKCTSTRSEIKAQNKSLIGPVSSPAPDLPYSYAIRHILMIPEWFSVLEISIRCYVLGPKGRHNYDTSFLESAIMRHTEKGTAMNWIPIFI